MDLGISPVSFSSECHFCYILISSPFLGFEYLDTVTISPELVIHQQSIGAANTSNEFAEYGVDGILE